MVDLPAPDSPISPITDKPMPAEPRGMAIFQIFANRAAAELQRLAAERAASEREAQLRLLVDNAMDAIVDFDDEFKVALMNPAARRVFGYADAQPLALDVRDLLSKPSQTSWRLNCSARTGSAMPNSATS